MAPYCLRLGALTAHGLTRFDLTWCWISGRIQPLSLRGDLMCNYTGDPEDVHRFNPINLSEDEVTKNMKKFLSDFKDKCNLTGLAPFCPTNHVPPADFDLWKVWAQNPAPPQAEQENETVGEATAGRESEKTQQTGMSKRKTQSSSQELSVGLSLETPSPQTTSRGNISFF
ncbi:uncharacterized protein LOC123452598 [Hordeum vulgare subsp. vulgare]|uniref:uncharacterized protein LOC123452598 n=1 Tax=Hordeum vulgare subsp. vulgare TaxID=112509 RepID=UPI001D1A53B9|nr:uncharacterized protein LOC123452598 [Hordeum vulgare subsp. vulgare]